MKTNELIERLRNIVPHCWSKIRKKLDDIADEIADTLEAQQKRIAELEKERRWIPVTERLPKLIPCDAGTAYSEAVNVLTDGRKVLTAIWNGHTFLCDADYWEAWDEKITHWTPVLLPLPEPPKEG